MNVRSSIRHVLVQILHVLFQLAPDRRAVVEERRRVVAGEARPVRERLAQQTLEMAALDEEDVVDELADRREPPAGLNRGLERVSVAAEPAAPFLALAVGVAKQLVEGSVDR